MSLNSGSLRRRFSVGAAIVALIALSFAGSAWGMYLNDAAKPKSPAGYDNPGDGFCVKGIKTDGTMEVVPGINNFRDCVAFTTGLTGMTAVDVTATYPTSATCCTTGATGCTNNTNPFGVLNWVAGTAKCYDNSACTVQGATGNDGAKHSYSLSLCVNPSTRAGISRLDLDNTAANCQEKGGVLADGLYGHPAGACAAYGWVYGGVKSDSTLPDISGGKGVTSAANLGFCYATMRMTTAGYGTAVLCPSVNNLSLYCAGGANIAKACTVATQAADCPGSTCTVNAGWGPGTVNDGVRYQGQASYDAGLGWSFASSQCLYQYGVKGFLGADLRGPNNVVAPAVPLCDGTTGAATVGACVDLTGITTQGECLAVGGNWDNWLPVGNGAVPYATNVTVATTTYTSTIKKLDATTTIAAGGGKFYSGTGSVCLKCHADQSRQTMERQKPGYVETGHKLAGDVPAWATVGADWGLKGVQCEICHATGKPTAQDVGTIIYQTKICVGGTEAAGTACDATHPCTSGGTCTAGVPRAASGHNQTEYGTHVTGVCFTCHGTTASPANTNPTVVPVTAGDFALTAKNLAPIGNEFLGSPHAKYSGSSNKLDIITKTNYLSSFDGQICRGGSDVTDAATTANGVDVTALSTCGVNSNAACNTLANCNATASGNRSWNAITSKCYDRVACTTGAGKTWDAGTLRCVENQATCTAQSDSGYNFIWSTTGVAGNASLVTTSGAGCFKPFGSGTIYATYYDTATATPKRIPFLDTYTNTACSSKTLGAGAFWIADGEVAGSTSNGVAYPATDGPNCMTCHDVHWSLESTDPEAEPIRRECTTCHAHPVGDGGSATNAPQISLTRYNHPSVPGTPFENIATDPNEACETCHMPKSSAASTAQRMHLWRISTNGAYTTMGATTANTEADGTYGNASWVDVNHACGQCHGGGTVSTAPVYPVVPPAIWRSTTVLADAAKGMHSYADAPNNPPTVVDTRTATANTWTLGITDQSTDDNGIAQEVVNWGDGSVVADDRTAPFGPFTHSYVTSGTYLVTHKAIDRSGQISSKIEVVTWSYFTISGVVKNLANTVLPGVTVTVLSNATGNVVTTAVTDDTGAYTVASLKPGVYTVSFMLAGYTFNAPSTVTVGPNATLNVNSTNFAPAPARPPRLKKSPGEVGTLSNLN